MSGGLLQCSSKDAGTLCMLGERSEYCPPFPPYTCRAQHGSSAGAELDLRVYASA